MSKIVNHSERRIEIADACLRVVSRAGLSGATTREIAKEAGVSHGVIAHYFNGKNDILRAALQRSYQQLAARIDTNLSGLSGTQALRRAVYDALPIDQEDKIGEQIELAFWAYALGNAELAEERWRSYSEWRRALELLIRSAQAQEHISEPEPSLVAETIICTLDGLGAQVALYPDRITAERMYAIMDATLAGFGFVTNVNT
ncbi:TetR/AcrR family transcriptional regulator [Bifidobacterium sp.]|jgi:AcrR family transcriptional regulator|uniref:TetR/AcrR family transcriptional regulator n=1 Tax=Bifidobacterium sp. TaxID=41200 RepID=UPI0025B82E34|nr:TetR/AcrR family transcriptional regulator [Bifidobacterium sp.]MCI1635227.1 TetR family transcriptional regulator [Bifidobacterium sp.]